ncbi:hypothetical protein LptCag_2619 [Leptospirillum ferriphilum]|uniref:Uncharacterized protein n=1 Tax=Leptospirillum ferriphilum TaxID=178606 RepID=A0A094WF73_9BACT|nr:hypothetical protein LptCag_2619 [Leptospirillum ferriphilum]
MTPLIKKMTPTPRSDLPTTPRFSWTLQNLPKKSHRSRPQYFFFK